MAPRTIFLARTVFCSFPLEDIYITPPMIIMSRAKEPATVNIHFKKFPTSCEKSEAETVFVNLILRGESAIAFSAISAKQLIANNKPAIKTFRF